MLRRRDPHALQIYADLGRCIRILLDRHRSCCDCREGCPEFIGAYSLGQTHKLSDYRGEFVVLEWTNNGHPFTRKHYNSGNMQSLQRECTATGVVWLTVLSSGPGQEGYMTPSDENAYIAKVHANPTAAILDSN